LKQLGPEAQPAQRGMPPIGLIAGTCEPMIDPTRDILKSVTRVAVVAMRPDQSVTAQGITNHYTAMFTRQGWSSMVSARFEQNGAFILMLAPEGKGLFGLFIDHNQAGCALVTTDKPIGDMLGQIIRAGAPAVSQLRQMALHRGGGPVPTTTVAEKMPAPDVQNPMPNK
jgi:hypothetical protein